MYTSVLKGYISRFNFITQKNNSNIHNIEINVSNNNQSNQIDGTIIINQENEEKEIIFFETKISKTDDILIFKTKYQSNGKILEETDTFAITEIMQYGYSTPKIKLLLHIVEGKIIQAYRTSKKYKFENGINENLTQLNMNNQDVVNFLNNIPKNSHKK